MSRRRMATSALLLGVVTMSAVQAEEPLDAAAAGRFAALALACVHQEYPNKIGHVLQNDADVKPPRELTPAFYGCFDWHSAVHGHWLLARLARLYPEADFAPRARAALAESLTPEHIAAEVAYLEGPGRASFERPYGLAWLLQLEAELAEWGGTAKGGSGAADGGGGGAGGAAAAGKAAERGAPVPATGDPDARRWAETLAPLVAAARERLAAWLPKLAYPIRIGEHAQTAFSFGLMLDWARTVGDDDFAALLTGRIDAFYRGDRDCPLAYEPSGEDFLSPCLAEADLLRRVLPPQAFAAWLQGSLPTLPADPAADWLPPALVTDRADPKLAHLDGLNLSRAWMLEGIASGLPPADPRRPALLATARRHREASLPAVTGEHYEGGHWLGTFATYLVTGRGLG
jgi:Protein of unknown function (DUF2891)